MIRATPLPRRSCRFRPICRNEPGYPSHEALIALGARFLREEQTRVVELDGRRFVEGMLGGLIDEITDNVFELMERGRPNKTDKSNLQ